MTRDCGLWKPTFLDGNSGHADSQPWSPWVRHTDVRNLRVFAQLGAHGKPSIKHAVSFYFRSRFPPPMWTPQHPYRPLPQSKVNTGFSVRWLERKSVDLESEVLDWRAACSSTSYVTSQSLICRLGAILGGVKWDAFCENVGKTLLSSRNQ